MQFLLEYAEREDVQAIVGQATRFDNVQGVVLDWDEVWYRALTLSRRYGPHYLMMWRDFIRYRDGWTPFMIGLENPAGYGLVGPITYADFQWRPDYWKYYCDSRGWALNADPIIIKICLRPPQSPEELLPRIETNGLPLIYEVRPRASLALATGTPAPNPAPLMTGLNPKHPISPVIGGISIGEVGFSSGTLGGVLEDASGVRYAMTCGHVLTTSSAIVQQPAPSDHSSPTTIGTCCLLKAPSLSQNATVCNPFLPNSAQNEIDVALVKLTSKLQSDLQVLNVGRLTAVAARSSVYTYQAAEFMGKTSGHRMLEVGGLAVSYSFPGQGGLYCFKNLFELRFPNFLRLMLGRPVRGGDSGAWVCAHGASGTELVGMIIGEDRLHGYAMYAETAISYVQNNGYSVHV